MTSSSGSFLSAGKMSSSTIAAGARVGEHELERGVRLVEVEDDRLVVRRLDGVGLLQDAVPCWRCR